MAASPWPPPPHSATAPMPPPRRRSSCSMVSASRLPLMPIGWPRAIAPPLTLTMSSLMPSSRDRGDADGGERLVDLEQVDVGHGEAGLLGGLQDRPARLVEERRVVGAGDHAVRDELAERRDAATLGLGPRHQHDRAGAVGELRCVAGGDRAVRVERRASARRGSRSVVPGRTPSSCLDEDRVTLALRHADRARSRRRGDLP